MTKDDLNDFICKYGCDICIDYLSYQDDPIVTFKLGYSTLEMIVDSVKNHEVNESIEIKELDTDPSKIIVLKFDLEKTPRSAIEDYYQLMSAKNPSQQILAIPSEFDMIAMTKEELQKLRDKVSELILVSDFDSIVNIDRQTDK